MTKKIPKKNDRIGIDKYGRSELHQAVIDDDKEKVQYCIENKLNVNLPDDNGWTPLHFAAQNYSFDIITILLNSGANINCVDSYGNSPLFKAIFNSSGKDLKILNLFIEGGADLHKKNNAGVSVIDLINTIDNDQLKDFFAKAEP